MTIGQVVMSIAGRDAGKKMIVTQICDASYVLVADGDLRKIENPKKKKVKHLKMTDVVAYKLAEKWESGMYVNNAEIRKYLKEEGMDFV